MASMRLADVHGTVRQLVSAELQMRTAIADRQSEIGFTLVELLVVITIIVVLLALLAPAMDRAVEAGMRAVCGANTRTWALTAAQYAMDHRKSLPVGKPEGTDHAQNIWGGDHMGQFRWQTWLVLHEQYGLQDKGSICTSIGLLPQFWKPYKDTAFGDPANDFIFSTFPGLTYWGARKQEQTAEYTFPRKVGDNPTSLTLVTCYCYNDIPTGGRWVSYAPHTSEGGMVYPKGVAFDPVPEGLAVAYTDVSARWVKWDDLIELRYGSFFYYDGR
jgi:prepilin-type N-terminal cleavage/methylation domain-containing protein